MSGEVNHKVGWHIGNVIAFDSGQKSVIRDVPPVAVTFITGEQFRPDDMKWILNEINPDCHFIFRPYFAPSDSTIAYQNYIHAVESLIAQSTWDFIPEPQRHLQIFNEQNMPRWSQWEGFGDTVEDMKRFNDWFVKGYKQLKAANPTFKIGWTPLTPGNRDAYFRTDAQNVPYYMHGPEAAKDNPTAAEIRASIVSGPCYDSLMLADEYYAHIYVMNDAENQIHEMWGGKRWLQYEKFLPKPLPIWINELGIQHGAWSVWYDMLDQYPQVLGTTIWRLGHEIKSKDSPPVPEIKTYLEQRDPPPDPPDPPKPPSLSLEEVIRHEVRWEMSQDRELKYYPQFAFTAYAREHNLACQLTNEFDITYGGVDYRIQGFGRVIVYAEIPKWDQIKRVSWQ